MSDSLQYFQTELEEMSDAEALSPQKCERVIYVSKWSAFVERPNRSFVALLIRCLDRVSSIPGYKESAESCLYLLRERNLV